MYTETKLAFICSSGEYTVIDISSLLKEGTKDKTLLEDVEGGIAIFPNQVAFISSWDYAFSSKTFWILVFRSGFVPEAMGISSMAEHSYSDSFSCNKLITIFSTLFSDA